MSGEADGRHVRRVPGGLLLSDHACTALLGLFDDARRVAALSPLGSTTASMIGAVGRAGRTPSAGTGTDRTAEAPVGASCASDDHLDAVAVADLLGCKPRNVRALATRGTLPGTLLAGRWTFTRAVVEAHARGRR